MLEEKVSGTAFAGEVVNESWGIKKKIVMKSLGREVQWDGTPSPKHRTTGPSNSEVLFMHPNIPNT